MRLALAILLAAAAPAAAHEGVAHSPAGEAPTVAAAPSPFPFKLGGKFELTDQHGARRSEVDPAGSYQLLFFGYATCRSICPVAISLMEETAAVLAERGLRVQPLLVTVDPARDTPASMNAAMMRSHAGTLGLTGSEAELAKVRKLFQVERKVMFEDPELGPIYAHGSHIYLLDPHGAVLTLIPPVVTPERGAEIVMTYVRR
jgi:protein SCO1/2